MQNIRNKKYYEFKTSEEGYIVLDDGQYVIKNDDALIFPLSFDRKKLMKNCKILHNAIKEKIIKNEGGKFNVSFDVSLNHNLSYEEWKIILEFAKQMKINFRVNSYEEYTPLEMENYINKFSLNHKMLYEKEIKFHTDNKLLKKRNLMGEELKVFNNYITFNINNDKENLLDYLTYVVDMGNNEIIFDIEAGQAFDKKAKMKVISLIKYLKNDCPSNNFNISFSNYGQYYTKEEFKNLLKIESYIKDNLNKKYSLSFIGDGVKFNKSQIINANMKISDIVEDLKKSDLSPYEKIIYAHKIISEFDYVSFPENDDLGRNLYSVLNSRNMICVGYAALFNAIFEELNDPNIKMKMDAIYTYNGDLEKTEFHALNCVYLKDNKYNIEGYYNLDACSNHGKDSLNYFMIPTIDIDHSYASISVETRKTAIYAKGNIYSQTIPFSYSVDGYFDYEYTVGDLSSQKELLKNTQKFLDTTLGNEKRKKLKINSIDNKDDAIKVINECIKYSYPISKEQTYEALVNSMRLLLDLKENEACEYAKYIINKSSYNALFLYERNCCYNCFAKNSLEIENREEFLERKKDKSR